MNGEVKESVLDGRTIFAGAWVREWARHRLWACRGAYATVN